VCVCVCVYLCVMMINTFVLKANRELLFVCVCVCVCAWVVPRPRIFQRSPSSATLVVSGFDVLFPGCFPRSRHGLAAGRSDTLLKLVLRGGDFFVFTEHQLGRHSELPLISRLPANPSGRSPCRSFSLICAGEISRGDTGK